MGIENPEMKEIILNKKFYSRECIDRAMQEFGHRCRVSVRNEPDHFRISIECDGNISDIEKEFSNHCLGLMK